MPFARPFPFVLAALVAVGMVPSAFGQSCCKPESPPPGGSTSFCLYELPLEEGGRKRWINLGIVQYIEVGRNEVRIAYGGGRFGSGYETRIPVASEEEAMHQVERMRKTAAACR